MRTCDISVQSGPVALQRRVTSPRLRDQRWELASLEQPLDCRFISRLIRHAQAAGILNSNLKPMCLLTDVQTRRQWQCGNLIDLSVGSVQRMLALTRWHEDAL